MKKVSRKGFSTIEAVLVLIIIAIVGFVIWYVFHTKNTTNNIYGNAANTSSQTPAQSSTNNSTSTKPIIQTKTDATLGKYLADGNGKPLYIYAKDTANTSNCTGSCLSNWPAYKATSTTANLPANVGTITRSDGGGVQYTYKKMPLYYFTGDTGSSPTGNGVQEFTIATP